MSMSSPANDHSHDPSPPAQSQDSNAATESEGATADPPWQHFQALLPLLQREWPEIAREHWEATGGKLEELVQLIASRTSHTRTVVRAQLLELVDHMGRIKATPKAWDEMLHPLADQLDTLIEELRQDLRPRLRRSIQQQPLLSLSVAILAGFVTGLLLGGGRRQP